MSKACASLWLYISWKCQSKQSRNVTMEMSHTSKIETYTHVCVCFGFECTVNRSHTARTLTSPDNWIDWMMKNRLNEMKKKKAHPNCPEMSPWRCLTPAVTMVMSQRGLCSGLLLFSMATGPNRTSARQHWRSSDSAVARPGVSLTKPAASPAWRSLQHVNSSGTRRKHRQKPPRSGRVMKWLSVREH